MRTYDSGKSVDKYFKDSYKRSYNGAYARRSTSKQEPERMYKQQVVQRLNPSVPTEEELDQMLLPPEKRQKGPLTPYSRRHLKNLELEAKHRFGDDIDILRREFTKTPAQIENETFKLLEETRRLEHCVHVTVLNAPKIEKYNYGMDMKASARKIHRDAVMIKRKYYRKNLLEEIDVECDILRDMYFAAKTDYPDWITTKYYTDISDSINRVAKINGGLLKTTVA